jgi:hypothetical protein
MNVLVCGDRNWTDRASLFRALTVLDLTSEKPITGVVEGEATGADTMAREWADQTGIKVLSFPANWRKYGKAAGPMRNQQMLDEGKPELVVYFHPDLANSRGTGDMVRRAKKAGIEVINGMELL